jgi:hypothetical protein
MSTEEKMLWSSLYAASYIKDGDSDSAIQRADEGIEELRNTVKLAKILRKDFGYDMAKEMLK